MAEDPQPMTLVQRIAALNAAHIGRIPGEPPLPRPKPQIPTKRPIVIRQKTINNPPEQTNGTVTAIRIGNKPAENPQPHNVRPAPVLVRTAQATKIPPRTSTPQLPRREPSQPPPLPRRDSSRPPPLPSRNGSSENSRRGSDDSTGSYTNESHYRDGATLTQARSKSSDRIKAPAWGEEPLPTLPPRGGALSQRKYSSDRPKYVNRAPTSEETIVPGVTLATLSSPPDRPKYVNRAPTSTEAVVPILTLASLSSKSGKPSVPPRLPSRKSQDSLTAAYTATPLTHNNVGEKIPPMPSTDTIDRIKQRVQTADVHKLRGRLSQPQHVAIMNSSTLVAAPPIPLSSKPDLSAIQGTKLSNAGAVVNTASTQPQNNSVCMVCRDFAAPDHHATLFPRSQVTSLQALAQQLTTPFSSLTDKARAIFAWLHHNISYDVQSFFNHNVQASTPQSTLHSGLAVCEGFAALFTNLATYAGLESIVVGGHGKGFGHQNLAPGSPVPPFEGNHAWNAVKVDHGEWKLIDACWGAGHVQGKRLPYVAKFNENMFTMSNEEFGIKHYPNNKEHFFLPNSRRMAWEEYIQINPAYWPSQIEPPTVYTNAKEDYGVGERTVIPRARTLMPSQGGTVRFQFGLRCPHWTLDKHTQKGLPPVFMITVHGIDGRNKDHLPLEHIRGTESSGSGGDVWYVDVPACELGAPGQTITLFAVTSFGNRQDARGLTVKEFKEGKGRVGMGFTGVAAWELV